MITDIVSVLRDLAKDCPDPAERALAEELSNIGAAFNSGNAWQLCRAIGAMHSRVAEAQGDDDADG